MGPLSDTPVVSGLPPNVEFVHIGTPTEDEFYITNEPDGKGGHVVRIVSGPRASTFPSQTPHLSPAAPAVTVIVKPAEGYKFRANIRTLAYEPVKLLNPPAQITATVKFSVDNEPDEDSVKSALTNLRDVPGFVGIE